nr:unnamed protein product [Digitaria exilis]
MAADSVPNNREPVDDTKAAPTIISEEMKRSAARFLFSRPNSRACSLSSLCFADMWAHRVSSFFLALPAVAVSVSSFPSRKFPGLYKPTPRPLNPQPKPRALASPQIELRRRNPRVRAAASIRAFEFVDQLRAKVWNVQSLFSLPLSLSCARATLPSYPSRSSPSFLPSPSRRDFELPSPSFAQLRCAPPLSRRGVFPFDFSQNVPFEGDQDQVYEEEPPQYFEQGNDLDEF